MLGWGGLIKVSNRAYDLELVVVLKLTVLWRASKNNNIHGLKRKYRYFCANFSLFEFWPFRGGWKTTVYVYKLCTTNNLGNGNIFIRHVLPHNK